MSDLVTRLRNRIGYDAKVERMIDEAADRIETLEVVLKQVREAMVNEKTRQQWVNARAAIAKVKEQSC